MKLGKNLRVKDIKLIYNQFNLYLKNNTELKVYLHEVDTIDISGLALLLEFKCLATQVHKPIQFIDTPDCIYKLCELYQVNL